MSPFSAFGHFVTLETRWLVGFDLNTNFTLPTGNLDSKTTMDVMGVLKASSDKYHQTILMVTHNEAIAQTCDRIIRIEDGRVYERGGAWG